ncbi:transketolase family protein [soil metagenome]
MQDTQKEKKPTRDGYGSALLKLGKKNKNVVVLSADLGESMRTQEFGKLFPERLIEVGVAEQNLIGVAAGLALSGKIPFATSYAVFSPGRSWDQVRVSVAYSQSNVKIVGGHTGLTVGADGATHQALEDIAIMRVLPNMIVIVPCDFLEAEKATLAAAEFVGPVYLRLTREKSPQITEVSTPFTIGVAQEMTTGEDVTVIACGPLLAEALKAAKQLSAEGLSVEVINNHTIKPLDEKTLLRSIKKTGAVVTVEEHQIMGGMGSAIAELTARHFPVPIEMIGMHDQFGESGTPKELWEKYHFLAEDIVNAIKKVIKRKQD